VHHKTILIRILWHRKLWQETLFIILDFYGMDVKWDGPLSAVAKFLWRGHSVRLSNLALKTVAGKINRQILVEGLQNEFSRQRQKCESFFLIFIAIFFPHRHLRFFHGSRLQNRRLRFLNTYKHTYVHTYIQVSLWWPS
jgi:hypothetical protein